MKAKRILGRGLAVTLALAPHKARVIADLPDSFVTINVLAGTETAASDIFSNGPLTAVDLERFADSFGTIRTVIDNYQHQTI